MTEIRLSNVSVKIDEACLVDDVSITIGTKELVALVGPNGAGKTSLLRCLVGLVAPSAGDALINGAPAAAMAPADRARAAAYLPQTRPLAWPLKVRDIVALGRYAHGGPTGRLGTQDAKAVARALADCGLDSLAGRRADGLSGGELARVHVARAFAAGAPMIIADEPVAALDPRHQFSVLDLFRRHVDAGGGALVVLHDLSLAARFADRIIVMEDGAVTADGPPPEALTPARIEAAFGVRARVDMEASPFVTLDGLASP